MAVKVDIVVERVCRRYSHMVSALGDVVTANTRGKKNNGRSVLDSAKAVVIAHVVAK